MDPKLKFCLISVNTLPSFINLMYCQIKIYIKKKIKVAFQATKKQIEILVISQVFLKISTDNSKNVAA